MRSDFLQAAQHISRAAASASAGQRPLPHGPSKGGAGSSGTGGITWALVGKAAPRVPGAAQTCRITALWAGLTPQVGRPLAPGGSLCYDFGNRSLEEERTLLSYRASLKLKREKMQKCDYFVFVSIWDGLSCENVDCTAHRWARLELLQRTAPSGTDGGVWWTWELRVPRQETTEPRWTSAFPRDTSQGRHRPGRDSDFLRVLP